MEKDKNNKLWCYLLLCSDIIFILGGSVLTSLAIFGPACGAADPASCCLCPVWLGIPMMVLGLLIHCWCRNCCGGCCNCECCKSGKCCKTEKE